MKMIQNTNSTTCARSARAEIREKSLADGTGALETVDMAHACKVAVMVKYVHQDQEFEIREEQHTPHSTTAIAQYID